MCNCVFADSAVQVSERADMLVDMFEGYSQRHTPEFSRSESRFLPPDPTHAAGRAPLRLTLWTMVGPVCRCGWLSKKSGDRWRSPQWYVLDQTKVRRLCDPRHPKHSEAAFHTYTQRVHRATSQPEACRAFAVVLLDPETHGRHTLLLL